MQAAYALVNDDGTFSGSGIASVQVQSTGSYLVNYENDFPPNYGVTASPWGAKALTSLNIFAENVVEVRVTDLQGNPINSGFSVVAISN